MDWLIFFFYSVLLFPVLSPYDMGITSLTDIVNSGKAHNERDFSTLLSGLTAFCGEGFK